MTETYELYIDESGTFGDWQSKQTQLETECRVIGGIAVPATLVAKEQEMKDRLVQLQKKYFPEARNINGIHISELSNFSEQNQLRKSLEKIFKEEMVGAQIVFIYDRTPPKELENIPGAKFYRNMLFHLLQTVVFFHPAFEPDAAFSLKLAHRRFSYPSKFEDYLAGQGYLKLRSAIDGHTVLTAVTAVELENYLDSIQRALRFSSKRTVVCTVREYEKWDSPFMVMADWACNTLLYLLRSQKNDKRLLQEAEEIFGKSNILFFCPSAFDPPETIISAFYQNKYDQFLAGYLQREKQTYIPDSLLLYPAYKKVMAKFSGSSGEITDEQCETLMGIAENFLIGRLYNRLGDIRELLEIVKEKMENSQTENQSSQQARLVWRYHDAGLRYANHTGNIKRGRHHESKGLTVYKGLTDKSIDDVRTFHNFLNRASIISANEFAFNRACTQLEPIEKIESAISLALSGSRNEIYGKICGSLAQNYAFLGEKQLATHYFNIARNHLSTDKDQAMQSSFRAHWAVDQNDLKSYNVEMMKLMKNNTSLDYTEAVNQCLADLSNSENVFRLHIVLKGLLTFGDSHEKENVLSRLIDQKNYILKFKHHPWILIHTVVGRLFSGTNRIEESRHFWKTAVSSVGGDQVTIVLLAHAARAWHALSWVDKDNSKAIDILRPIATTLKILNNPSSQTTGIINTQGIADIIDKKVRTGWFQDVGVKFLDDSYVSLSAEGLKAICSSFIDRFKFTYW